MEVVEVVGTRYNKRKRNTSSGPRKKPRLYRQGALRGQVAFQGSYANRSSNFSLNQGNHGRELKELDTDVSAAVFDTTGSVILLNGVAQGSDFNTRIGRKFNMKSLLVRFDIHRGTTAAAPAMARWMIVYDKQTNLTAPAVTDVLQSANSSAFNNLTNRDRFIVIYDKILVVGATFANDNSQYYVKKYRRMMLETTNGGTGATVASIATGGLFLVTVGSVAAGTTAPVMGAAVARVRFTDD